MWLLGEIIPFAVVRVIDNIWLLGEIIPFAVCWHEAPVRKIRKGLCPARCHISHKQIRTTFVLLGCAYQRLLPGGSSLHLSAGDEKLYSRSTDNHQRLVSWSTAKIWNGRLLWRRNSSSRRGLPWYADNIWKFPHYLWKNDEWLAELSCAWVDNSAQLDQSAIL